MRGKEEKKEREDMRGDESRRKEKTEGRADKAGEERRIVIIVLVLYIYLPNSK